MFRNVLFSPSLGSDPRIKSTEDAAEVKKGNVSRANDAYDDFKGHLDTELSLVII